MIHLDADSVIEGIVQWCSRLRDIKDDAAFEIAWTETWAWITDPLRAATLNALLDGNEHPGMCELLPPFQRRWLAIKERKEAEQMISSAWGANAVAIACENYSIWWSSGPVGNSSWWDAGHFQRLFC